MKEYERLPKETKNKLMEKERVDIDDLIKNPIIIKTNNNYKISEKILQKLILEDIESFMIEYCSDNRILSRKYKLVSI